MLISGANGAVYGVEGPTVTFSMAGDLKVYIISRMRAVKSTNDKAEQERGSKEMEKAQGRDPGETMG